MDCSQQEAGKVVKKRMTSPKNPMSQSKNTLTKIFCSQCGINQNIKQPVQCDCKSALVYVGGSGVLTSQTLSKYDIGAVLSVMDYKKYEKEHIDQKVQDIDEIQQHQFIDMPYDHSDILPYLSHSYNYINEVFYRKFNLLIHSTDGVSRSPAIVIHYLMKKYQIDFQTAYSIIKIKKPQIDLKLSLIQQLKSTKY